MIYLGRLLLCALLSIGAHYLFERAAEHLPPLPKPVPEKKVTVRIVEPPPPPPELPPEPAPPPPPAAPVTPVKPIETPKVVKKTTPVVRRVDALTTPPPQPPHGDPDALSQQVMISLSMESTSTLGTNAVIAGGDVHGGGRTGSAAVGSGLPSGKAPAGAPVPAYEVTKMPTPEGRCAGRYTDEARQAGLEGTVVLDVVVGADGKTTDITVVHGLEHGLTEAAVTALRECRFSPGERDGQPVAVRVRGFKITFVLAN